ncbi:MAG: hypothetical protein V1755_10955 [Chloroflexota bacterium]
MKRDLRAFARQTNVCLAVGAFVLLFGVGLTLIFFIYGAPAALVGLLCLLGALVPIGLIFAALYGIDWIVKRARPR